MAKHMIIPDVQAKPGVRLDHLEWAGKYAAAKKPDVIICIGDFVDMPSLSSYDVGKKSFEGRRYKKDIEVAHKAMEMLMKPIYEEQIESGWNPKLILTLGNHEDRISRAVEKDPKLEGVIGLADLKYEVFGWKVIPYLETKVLHGVAYSHYFASGILGRPVTSASALLSKRHMSAVMGHVQQRQIAYGNRADGKQITGIFCGTFYQHDEEYLKWQGNKHWRGIWMLHNVKDGQFDEMPVSLDYLKRKYG